MKRTTLVPYSFFIRIVNVTIFDYNTLICRKTITENHLEMNANCYILPIKY